MALLLERSGSEESHAEEARPEAIRLDLFTQRFFTLVKEMGERLERTAVSTNVKERLDFSCAMLDADGRLVALATGRGYHTAGAPLAVKPD